MIFIRFIILMLLGSAAMPIWASPCRQNDWQPTYVHDLTNPNDSGPYYVMPNGRFVALTGDWTNQSGPGMCCLYGIRDRRGFTDCQNYTRVQCGCDRKSMVNDTCRRFLSARGVASDSGSSSGGGSSSGSGSSGVPQSCMTTHGRFAFTGQVSGLLARYPEDSGRIVGELVNNRIDGYWVEGSSSRRCSSSRDGSHFWGKFVANMSGNGFSGMWSYCDDPVSRAWNGSDCR
jgi:hypothetical protein